MTATSSHSNDTDTEGWRVLFYYNTYRLALTALLLFISSPVFEEISLSNSMPSLLIPLIGITSVSAVTYNTIHRRRPALHIQAHLLFILDIVFITMLTLSESLLASSTLILYFTTAAVTAILFHLRISLIYTFCCAGLIFYLDYLAYVDNQLKLDNYYLTPLLVVGLFSAVVIVGAIANRTRTAYTVVEKQKTALADLDQINQLVVDQLDLGILFLDQDLRIQMMNQSAEKLVGQFIDRHRTVTGRLAALLTSHQQPGGASSEFSIHVKSQELRTTSLLLRNGYLVQIDDQTTIHKKIQQSKMASIGRMASAISHEIRNPLSAINHAAQLLTPVKGNDEDAELIQIIRNHAKRIDHIVESILRRSRPGKTERKVIHLRPWLKVFIETFRETLSSTKTGLDSVELAFSGEDSEILFDPTQLEQVITNLCQNSVKYANPQYGHLKIRLHMARFWDDTPYLNLTDNGQGISREDAEQLFEPFYTSDSQSTGLGLFLVKEYCNLNGANIEYVRGSSRHGFRITFQSPEPDITEPNPADEEPAPSQ